MDTSGPLQVEEVAANAKRDAPRPPVNGPQQPLDRETDAEVSKLLCDAARERRASIALEVCIDYMLRHGLVLTSM